MNVFRRMTIKGRALLAIAVILLAVIGLNAGIAAYLSARTYRDALMARAAALAETITKDIDKAVEFGLALDAMAGTGERLREIVERNPDVSQILVMDREGRILYASDKALENTKRGDAATRRALEAVKPLVQAFSNASGNYYEKVIPVLNIERKPAGVFRIAMKADALRREIRRSLLLSLGVGLASFLAATAFISFFVGRSISGPLKAMSENAGRIAAGDLSRGVPAEGAGEIAVLGAALNAVSAHLRDMLSRLRQMGEGIGEALAMITGATQKMSRGAKVQQEATEQTAMTVEEMVASIRGVAETAAEMSSAATDASSSVLEMAASIEEVAKNAGVLSTATEDTASSIAVMTASIRQVSENVEALSSSAEQTSASITEMSASVKEVEQRAGESARLAEKVSVDASERGLAAAAEAIRGMEHIKQSVEATASLLNRLGARSQEIGSILKIIDEVTDQTGLLALNAAILASQAGEHGKGFAVVAEEIKDLAERTAVSTQEITNLIAAVQKEIGESVRAMAKGLGAVESGAALVRVTRDVLEQVAESSQKAADTARAIERTTAEQAWGVAQITEASAGVTHQIEQIVRATQEQRRGSDQITQATEKVRDITRRLKIATEEQTTGSKQIARAVDSATAQAAQIAKATSEQRQGSMQISTAVTRIQQITQESVDLSIELEMAMQTLRERAEALQTELKKFTL